MKSKRKYSFKDDSQLYKAPDKKYIQAGYPEEVDVEAVIECWKKKRMNHETQGQTLKKIENEIPGIGTSATKRVK